MNKQEILHDAYDSMCKLFIKLDVKFDENTIAQTGARYISIASSHNGYAYSLFVARESGNVMMHTFGRDFDMHHSCKIDDIADYSIEHGDEFRYLKIYIPGFLFKMRVDVCEFPMIQS